MIPSAFWAVFHIILDPGLTSRVRAETASCWDSSTERFDVASLCAKPLLTSIYMEALRHCVATSTARKPIVPHSRIGDFALDPNAILLSISWFGAHDAAFWNTGSGGEHPVEDFWAERFLEYAGDAGSGPVRKDEPVVRAAAERTAEDDKTAEVVTAGTEGHFYPYGGGAHKCPGRFFAKQEMMVAVALVLQLFEIEVLDPAEAKRTKPDLKYFPLGAMPPDKSVPFRIRRRP